MDEVSAMSVKELRILIERAGLQCTDCVEKSDLQQRACEARAELATAAGGAGEQASEQQAGRATAKAGVAMACTHEATVVIECSTAAEVTALLAQDFARSLGLPGGTWTESAERWHVSGAPWQNPPDCMWMLQVRLRRCDGSSHDSEIPFVFGDRFSNVDGHMQPAANQMQAVLYPLMPLAEGSKVLLFPASEAGWMLSYTGSIKLRNSGSAAVTLFSVPLSDDALASPAEDRRWSLRGGETQGFDFVGAWAIAVTHRGTDASVEVIEHRTSGGGMGNWLGMNGANELRTAPSSLARVV